MTAIAYLEQPDGARIAYCSTPGTAPGIVFLGGFMSDMTGTKALALEAFCRRHGRAYTRFDYFGHGASSGAFHDGTISRWRDDAVAVIDRLAEGPQILVGSSMGGWIMLLAALARPERIAGLVGIAAGPDFTEDLMWRDFDAATRQKIATHGAIEMPSDYGDEPYVITRRLIEDGRNNLVLRAPLAITAPVRLIHGMADRDVPWQVSLRLAEHITSPDVTLTLVKNGDHRLSEAADIARLEDTVETLAAGI